MSRSQQDSDIYGSQNRTPDAIAAVAKASAVSHVVMLSSLGADMDRANGPIKGLYHHEKKLHATGTRLTAIRAGYSQESIANAMGPARTAGIYPTFVPFIDHPIPMIATRDIAALAAKSLLADPGRSAVVDLYGPSYTMRQVARILGDALGRSSRSSHTHVKHGCPP